MPRSRTLKAELGPVGAGELAPIHTGGVSVTECDAVVGPSRLTPVPSAGALGFERCVIMKAVCDRCLACIGLIVLMPLLAFFGLLIKLTSKGPVFFVQRRVGQGGRTFGILKLRTMVVDAEQATGPIWAQENDPRITRVGRFLRATHLDEMPQLINVLKGDMSLVGPRPERPVFVEQFRKEIPGYTDRLSVKPGITGLAQVRHKYDETLRDVRRKLAYDKLYIRRMCLLLDIRIIFLTIGRLTGKGAR